MTPPSGDTPIQPSTTENCRKRSRVEHFFNKLKNWCRIATHYNKTKESSLGFVSIASALPFVTKPSY